SDLGRTAAERLNSALAWSVRDFERHDFPFAAVDDADLADLLAEQSLRHRRDVGNRAPGGVCLVLADDTPGLALAVFVLDRDTHAEPDDVAVGFRHRQLRRLPPCVPVAQVARYERDLLAVGRGLGARQLFAQAGDLRFDGGEAIGSNQIAVRTDWPLANIDDAGVVLPFARKRPAHGSNLGRSAGILNVRAADSSDYTACRAVSKIVVAGRRPPITMSLRFLRTGRATSSSCRASSGSPRRSAASTAATTTSAARPAPSSHLSAMPNPSSGTAAQKTPSAPVLVKMRPAPISMIRVSARPVPATNHGCAMQAWTRRRAALARSAPRCMPVTMRAKPVARLTSGTA